MIKLEFMSLTLIKKISTYASIQGFLIPFVLTILLSENQEIIKSVFESFYCKNKFYCG